MFFSEKMKKPTEMATFWLLFVQANLFHFHLNKWFKTWFVVCILRFQKWFDADILGFQTELCCRYFGLF